MEKDEGVIEMNGSSAKISIVIPTYNEAGNMLPLLSRIKQALGEENYEVIIVDDNSPDGTANRAIEASSELNMSDRVKVIVREKERGLSTAVIRGIESSSGDIVVVMDADLQHPPEDIKRIIHPIVSGKAEVSIGVRKGKGYRGLSFFRKIISRGASLVSKLLLPQTRNITDPMSGFFAFRRDVFLRTKGSLNPRGFKIMLELIVKGKVPDNKIAEVEYTFEKRQWGKSKLNSREMLNFVWHLLVLNEFRILKFMLVGVSGIFVNEGVLWLAYYREKILLEISAALGIESSIISNFILNSLLTFGKRKGGSIAEKLAKYHISTALGVSINYFTLLLLTRLFGIEPLLSNLIGIIFGFLANYALSEHFVWKETFSPDRAINSKEN
ncbi:MAG: glycosyltransferase family 2 protein [Fervidicoccaceae archaeon]